jgi:hypothetical protein
VVCADCRANMLCGWCDSPKHPTFGPGGHLVRPFRTGPKEAARSRSTLLKVCAWEHCAKEFHPSRKDQRYHAEGCKQRAKRARTRAA